MLSTGVSLEWAYLQHYHDITCHHVESCNYCIRCVDLISPILLLSTLHSTMHEFMYHFKNICFKCTFRIHNHDENLELDIISADMMGFYLTFHDVL